MNRTPLTSLSQNVRLGRESIVPKGDVRDITRVTKRNCLVNANQQLSSSITKVYQKLKKIDEEGPTQEDGLCFLTSGKRNIFKATASLLDVKERTVRRRVQLGGTNDTIRKSRVNKKIELDDFDRTAIRNRLYRYHDTGKHITLKGLLMELVRDFPTFDRGLSLESLRKILLGIGFKFKKYDDRIRLMEKSDIVTQRKLYLRRKRQLDQTQANFIFLDETWCNKNHHITKVWTDDSLNSTPKSKLGKGDRLIVTHAGGEDGFVENALDVFWSNSGKADYHQDMDSEYFETWLKEKLLPSLHGPSVIIMDNAKYHSRRMDEIPTSNSKKEVMKEWLKMKQIPFPEKALKPELYEIVKAYKPFNIEYVVDKIIRENGHEILRLPPYHCLFNPIEHIWSTVKQYVAKNNMGQNQADVKRLFEEGVAKVTPQQWKNSIQHCKKEEQKYWIKDGLTDRPINSIIIPLDEDSDSEMSFEDLDENDENAL